jgi:hypothetical protein
VRKTFESKLNGNKFKNKLTVYLKKEKLAGTKKIKTTQQCGILLEIFFVIEV